MCRSRRELSNKHLVAKIGVDTAENELLEVLLYIIQYHSFVSLLRTPMPLRPRFTFSSRFFSLSVVYLHPPKTSPCIPLPIVLTATFFVPAVCRGFRGGGLRHRLPLQRGAERPLRGGVGRPLRRDPRPVWHRRRGRWAHPCDSITSG